MTSIKKKRVSKKLKVSWRKHVNINDVEEYLEDTRLEERVGQLSEVKDSELFKVDTQPDPILSAKERKRQKLNKPLKCFSALESHSKVKDPIAKRNRVRTPEERKSKLVKQKELSNKLNGILKEKEKKSIQDKLLYELKTKNKPEKGEFNIDLWGEGNKHDIEKDEWTEKITKKHNLRNLGITQKSVVKLLSEKKSLLPTVEPPHPGMSYNPSYEDHQNLLKLVADKETEFIKKEEYLSRNTRGMFKKVAPSTRDKNWLVEMSQGLPSRSNPEEENTSDTEYKSVNPPVKNAKKTAKQRRKQKEQLELALQRKRAKIETRKITDIHQIKILKKQIEKTDQKHEILREKRKKRAAYKALEPKRISSTKFEDPGLDFNLGSDISGNLRNIKKEGNLLVDRFKSMQKRNILEPGLKRHRKNAKVKRFTKPGHKEDWKKTVAK